MTEWVKNGLARSSPRPEFRKIELINKEPREPDYPRKSSLPGIPGIAWPVRDPPPQRSASSDAPANQIARIAQRGVFTQPGSKREAAFLGPMPALATCGRTVPRSYVREVPQKQTLEATWQGRLHL